MLDSLRVDARPRAHVRVTPLAFRATPLGMGFGKARFASPSDDFRVLYRAATLMTSVAETIIRDRFVARIRRQLTEEEIESLGVTAVEAAMPLSLLDLRTTGLLRLGVPTNAVRGKTHLTGRRFSAAAYAEAPWIDGILYPSRLTGEDCIAVYDRAVGKLTAGPVRKIIKLSALEPTLHSLNITLIRKP